MSDDFDKKAIDRCVQMAIADNHALMGNPTTDQIVKMATSHAVRLGVDMNDLDNRNRLAHAVNEQMNKLNRGLVNGSLKL